MNNEAALGQPPAKGKTRKRELYMFLFLTVFFFPLLAVGLVAGYGFVIWIFQIIAGPPGPPAAF